MDSVDHEMKDDPDGQTAAPVTNGVSEVPLATEAVIVNSEDREVLSCLNEILSEMHDGVQTSSRSESEEAVLKCVSETTLKGLVDDVTDVREEIVPRCGSETLKETAQVVLTEPVPFIEVESLCKVIELGTSMVECEASKPFEAEVKTVHQRRDVPQNEESDEYSLDSEPDSSSSSSSSSSEEEEDAVGTAINDSKDGDDEESFTLEDVLNNKESKCSRYSGQIRTKGELRVEDLPPIQDLKISVDKKEIQLVGQVLSIVESLVVIQSVEGALALNLDSILFLDGGEPLGQIFDVFGPVIRPIYSVRFNTAADIKARNVNVGSSVFYAPQKKEFTSFVFAEQLRKMKGSDASWENNNEPPEEYIEYSDDEQEKLAKARRKNRNRKESNQDEQQQQQPKYIRKTERINLKQNRMEHKQYQQNYSSDPTRVAVVKPSSFSPRFNTPPSSMPPPFSYRMPVFQPPTYPPPPLNLPPPPPPYPPPPSMLRFNCPPPPPPPVQGPNPFYNVQKPSFPQQLPFMPPINLFELRSPPPPPPSPVPPFVPSNTSVSVAQPSKHNIWMPSRPFTQQPQESSSQSYSKTQNCNTSTELLPNPFRMQSNAAETSNVPRFPPVGFIPKM